MGHFKVLSSPSGVDQFVLLNHSRLIGTVGLSQIVEDFGVLSMILQVIGVDNCTNELSTTRADDGVVNLPLLGIIGWVIGCTKLYI